MLTLQEIKCLIQDYPNFPKQGIIFRDIMPVLAHPNGLASLNKHFEKQLNQFSTKPDAIIGIDARGFILGASLASMLKLPFIPMRKKGKLPGEVISYEYDLEYGRDCLEIQTSAIMGHKNIVLIDDLLATGGTIFAAEMLSKRLALNILSSLFVIELIDLEGRKQLNCPVFSLFTY